jgi:hypothetical protein
MNGSKARTTRAAVSPSEGTPPAPQRADTWPGPAAPLAWLAALTLMGVSVGGLLGLLVGVLSKDEVTVSADIQVVPDSRALSGPLDRPSTLLDTDNFVAAEQSWLDFQRRQQEDAAGPDVSIAVTQVGTSDVLRIRSSAPTAGDARSAVTAMLESYVDRRQQSAGASIQTALDAVQSRIGDIGGPIIPNSPQAQEYVRLLSQESELEAAAARVPGVVPVLHEPAVENSAGASGVLLSGLLGAVLGAVASLAAGAVWRATSSRLFDARMLVVAGVHVLLPRLPVGRIRSRTNRLPDGKPNLSTFSAASLLLPQVLDADAEPSVLLVIGAEPRSGAAEVTWALAWTLASGGTPVAVLTGEPGEGSDERSLTPSLTVVPIPADAEDELVAAAVKRHLANGRHVLLHAPTVSAAHGLTAMVRVADRAVVVVGEGASTLEESLATVRDLAQRPTPVLLGAVVTISGRHRAPRASQTGRHAPATDQASRQQEPVPAEA